MKQITAFPQYSVTESGQIYSSYINGFKSITLNRKGYPQVSLQTHKDGIRKMVTKEVHRFVAEAYCHKPEGCNVVNHLDNNPKNNHYTNLEWTTHSGNHFHAAKQGRLGHSSRILSETEVEEIWSLYLELRKETATKYGVCLGTIRAIYDGRTWKHLYNKYKHLKNTGAARKGDRKHGELCSTSKLTSEDVVKIVTEFPNLKQSEIAEIFGVDQTNISFILRGDTWCTVTYKFITPRKWPRGIPTPDGVDTTGWGFS